MKLRWAALLLLAGAFISGNASGKVLYSYTGIVGDPNDPYFFLSDYHSDGNYYPGAIFSSLNTYFDGRTDKILYTGPSSISIGEFTVNWSYEYDYYQCENPSGCSSSNLSYIFSDQANSISMNPTNIPAGLNGYAITIDTSVSNYNNYDFITSFPDNPGGYSNFAWENSSAPCPSFLVEYESCIKGTSEYTYFEIDQDIDPSGLGKAYNIMVLAAPEPETWMICIAGSALVGGWLRRRRRQLHIETQQSNPG